MGRALEGSGAPLLIASGVLGLASGRPGREDDDPVPGTHPRTDNARLAVAFAERGVRPVVVRFAPTVHGRGDHGFVARLVAIARERGTSGYVGDGANRWPAVHVLDAAHLLRLGVEGAAAGSALHAVAEQGIATRDIAEVIGRHLDVPVASVPVEQAAEHFGWLGRFFATDAPMSNDRTRELLGWKPTHPGLIEDLDEGHYFAT